MSVGLSCQDQYYVGGQYYDYPSSISTSASVDISMETWVSQWPSSIPGNHPASLPPPLPLPLPQTQTQPESQPEPQAVFSDFEFSQDEFVWTDHLSSQLYKNKQLQETLEQKEEELAQLHEENSKLREYLTSTYVKSLEDKAKKLLTQSGRRKGEILKCKRRLFEPQNSGPEPGSSVSETYLKKGRAESLSGNEGGSFSGRDNQRGGCVESWVLQTLGLKDVNTIDDDLSANYSAITSDDLTSIQYSDAHLGATVYSSDCMMSTDYPIAELASIDFPAGPCGLESSPLPPHYTPPTPLPNRELEPFYACKVTPNKTDVAFSTSLSPHRNVKTHSFHQGQAFVRRDEEGGWKFTWVPSHRD